MYRKYNQYSIFLVIGSAVLVYIYNDFLCLAENCYEREVAIFEPLFFGLLTILPTLFFLLFFPTQIFISWIKHIVWWFVLGITFSVHSVNPYSSGVLSVDRTQVALFWMAILFLITLVYAPVMNMKLKKNNS